MRLLLTCLGAVLALWAPLAAQADTPAGEAPLHLGVVPYLSARALVQLYHPLQEHLERELQRPVRLVTATDYATFLDKTTRQQYDVVATSPALARLAQRDAGWQPLARPVEPMQLLLVVREDSPVRELAQLRGQPIAGADPLSTLTLAGQRALAVRGLAGADLRLRATGSHANALAVLQQGGAAAALTTVTALRQVGPALARGLRVLAPLDSTTPLLFMAAPSLPAAQTEAVRQALLAFPTSGPAGQRFVADLHFGGLVPVSAADMDRLEPLLSNLRAVLENWR